MTDTNVDIDQLIGLLAKQAESTPGDDVPEEQDAREQGDGAGSTVTEQGGGDAERVTTEASPDALEAETADDNKNPIPGSTVEEEDNTSTTDSGPASGGVDIVKQAEAMEAHATVLDGLAESVMKQAAADAAEKAKAEQELAVQEEAIAKVAKQAEAELDLSPEEAEQMARGIADGSISPEEYGNIKTATAQLAELSETFQVPPEQVLHAAEAIGQEAIEKGMEPEQILQHTIGVLKQAAVEAAMPKIKAEYDEAHAVVKNAEAEGASAFEVKQAEAKMAELLSLADTLQNSLHAAMGPLEDDDEDSIIEEDVPAGEETAVEELPPEEVAEDVLAAGGEDEVAEGVPAEAPAGEEDIAAAVEEAIAEEAAGEDAAGEIAADEGEPVAPESGLEITPEQIEQLMALQAATGQLQEVEGIDDEIIKQAAADLLEAKPVTLHAATAEECLKKDPRTFARVFLEATIREITNKGQE